MEEEEEEEEEANAVEKAWGREGRWIWREGRR